MLPNLPIAPPNLPARRQPQAPAEPVRARTGADLSARREPRGAEPSFKELLRQDLSAARGKDRPDRSAEVDGAAERSASAGSTEASEVRAADDAAAAADAAGAQDARSGVSADDGSSDGSNGGSDGAASRDDAGGRGQATDEGDKTQGQRAQGDETRGDQTRGDENRGDENQGDKTQGESSEAEAAAALAMGVTTRDTVASRWFDGEAVDAGAARAAPSEALSSSTGDALQATRPEFGARLDTGPNTGPNTGLNAGTDGGRAQASSQQVSSQQISNQKPSLTQGTDSQAADALNARVAASAAASDAATAVATSPLTAATATPAVPKVPSKSTETGSSSTASATAAAARASASSVALGAEADNASAAIRALEDAVLAARADRASSPTDAASRAADPALARVAAMEADLAAERVAQALGQGLVEFDGADGQARAAGNATAPEKRPAANQTNGADARMMADAMAAERGGSTNASAASAGSTTAGIAVPFAMAQPSISSGLTALGGMLGADGLAADLARQPSDGASPGAQLAAKGLGILANQRGGAITMRLEPPALGQLRIELQVSQGAVVADFTAATAEARALLEANLGMLRERLESQGLSVERITIHGARTAEAATQSSGDQRQEQGGNADARDRGGERRQDAAGGESRGRRDRDPGSQHELAGRANRRQGGFASALDSAAVTPAARRSA
jgi:flagellar hook-length control protein FliK